MNGFGFGGNNCCLWILIIVLLLCCNGCNILDNVCGIFDGCWLPIILAVLLCFCKSKGSCGGGGFFSCK